MNNSTHDAGFVYVATGDRYWDEAERSARQLRETNPGWRICVITDKARESVPFWDDLVILEHPHFGFRDKIEMLRCPYKCFVYLDTDVHVFGDVSDLFAILQQFDACGVQLFEGHDYHIDGIPDAYSETNGGVLGFQRSATVEGFFAEWERLYKEYLAQNAAGNYHYANVGDQKSLRAALWNSPIRFAPIGPEFNFIPFRIDFASLPVKALHTRAAQDLAMLTSRLNKTLGRRAYFPELDVVISNEIPSTELRRLFSASLRQILRRALRKLIPMALRNRLRNSERIKNWFFGNRYESPSSKNESKWAQPPSDQS